MENLSFHLEGIVREKDSVQNFEGPLSLILMLLQKNKIEIRDLCISDILDQYLEYLDRMQRLDLEIASEFVQMASHLLYLKTRTLLTSDEELSELEMLMQSLEQLQARDQFENLTSVIPQLRSASEEGILYLLKPPEPMPVKKQEYSYCHEPIDLLRAMLAVWTRGGSVITPESERRLFAAMPRQIVYSVKTKGLEIARRVRNRPQSLTELYAACASESEIVATFVAVLELCNAGSLRFEYVEDQIILKSVASETEIEMILQNFEDGS